MQIEFVDLEINTVINALDFYSRIWIGQYDHILSELRWYRDCSQLDKIEDQAKVMLLKMRSILLPELTSYSFYASHGIFNPDVDYRAGVAYDLQQVIRYERAMHQNPEGGWSVDFNPPMKAENDPYAMPKASCRTVGNKIIETVTLNVGQLEIIKLAIIGYFAMLNGDIYRVFSLYTDDEAVLKHAEQLRIILQKCSQKAEADYPRALMDKIEIAINKEIGEKND